MTVSTPAHTVKVNRPQLTLSTTTRKTVLVTHIVSAGVWIGIDVIAALLVIVG
jgi:hypothetical protein